MAKKKTLKAQVIDDQGEVSTAASLSGTTRLEFSLNKNDVIEYFLLEQEQELQTQIKENLERIEELRQTADQIRSKFDKAIETRVLKNNKAVIKDVKKALRQLQGLGFRPEGYNIDSVRVNFSGLRINSSRYNNQGMFVDRHGRYKNLGSKVPPEIWNMEGYECYNYFNNHLRAFSLDLTEVAGERVTEATLNVGGATSAHQNVVWDDELEGLANDYLAAHLDRAKEADDLYQLLLRYDSLPSLKKQIKRQVVGRVLKNTDEGQVLLEALKGIRSAGASLLTTDLPASDS